MSKADQKIRPNEATDGQPRTSSGSKRLFKRSGEAVWLTPKGRDLVISLGTEGASKDLVAHRLGITPAKFDEIIEKDETGRLAYEQGKAEHEHLLIQALTSQAIGDDETRGVTQAAKELLEKVHGKKPDEGSNITIILPDALPMDEYLRRVKAINSEAES